MKKLVVLALVFAFSGLVYAQNNTVTDRRDKIQDSQMENRMTGDKFSMDNTSNLNMQKKQQPGASNVNKDRLQSGNLEMNNNAKPLPVQTNTSNSNLPNGRQQVEGKDEPGSKSFRDGE